MHDHCAPLDFNIQAGLSCRVQTNDVRLRKHRITSPRLAFLAFALVTSARAQTPTTAATPGQSATAGTSTVTPATSTQSTPIQSSPVTQPVFTQPGRGPVATLPGSPGVVTALQPGQAVTLDQALALAQANEPVFVTAAAAARVAGLDRSIAKSALLPSAVYHNQYLFTSSNHAGGQAFIANNAVHEYVSQGLVTERLGLAEYNALGRAGAALAFATAELEIARRGLTATVVGLYYASSTALGRISIQQRALAEANDFATQTTQREAAREVAHADVLKAQLSVQQRQRDVADAQLTAEKARLDLGVLLYPDPRTPYTVVLPTVQPLPDRATVDAAAHRNNPELASAMASFRASSFDVIAARAAYLPSLVLNYSYGIDAAAFAANGPSGIRNLGYSASATVDLPIWDWLATQHRVKQAEILRDAARVTLTSTQRRLIATLDEFYSEMRVAHDQFDSLQTTVETARESLRLTRLRYSNGEGTVLEVVDAQNTLTTSELAFQDGTVRYQLALANLQTLTGTF